MPTKLDRNSMNHISFSHIQPFGQTALVVFRDALSAIRSHQYFSLPGGKSLEFIFERDKNLLVIQIRYINLFFSYLTPAEFLVGYVYFPYVPIAALPSHLVTP